MLYNFRTNMTHNSVPMHKNVITKCNGSHKPTVKLLRKSSAPVAFLCTQGHLADSRSNTTNTEHCIFDRQNLHASTCNYLRPYQIYAWIKRNNTSNKKTNQNQSEMIRTTDARRLEITYSDYNRLNGIQHVKR